MPNTVTDASARTDHPSTPPIAPAFPLSPADKAAHAEASFVRAPKGTLSARAAFALRRVQENLAYVERDQQLDETVAAEIAQDVAA